jgi:hypothetical protein
MGASVKQGKLFGKTKSKAPAALSRDYDRRNLEIAKDFLANPDLAGGPDSFGMIWARLCVARLEQPKGPR